MVHGTVKTKEFRSVSSSVIIHSYSLKHGKLFGIIIFKGFSRVTDSFLSSVGR